LYADPDPDPSAQINADPDPDTDPNPKPWILTFGGTMSRCDRPVGGGQRQRDGGLKRDHLALQNMKYLNFFLLLWVIFVLLDPDPDPKH
jgi:hypothetical protein